MSLKKWFMKIKTEKVKKNEVITHYYVSNIGTISIFILIVFKEDGRKSK